jgi:hypothetical protein
VKCVKYAWAHWSDLNGQHHVPARFDRTTLAHPSLTRSLARSLWWLKSPSSLPCHSGRLCPALASPLGSINSPPSALQAYPKTPLIFILYGSNRFLTGSMVSVRSSSSTSMISPAFLGLWVGPGVLSTSPSCATGRCKSSIPPRVILVLPLILLRRWWALLPRLQGKYPRSLPPPSPLSLLPRLLLLYHNFYCWLILSTVHLYPIPIYRDSTYLSLIRF